MGGASTAQGRGLLARPPTAVDAGSSPLAAAQSMLPTLSPWRSAESLTGPHTVGTHWAWKTKKPHAHVPSVGNVKTDSEPSLRLGPTG